MSLSLLISLFLLISIAIFHTIIWFKKETIMINHNECLFGKEKKVNGMLFNSCLDYHHISHIILYFIIGLIYPNNYFFIFIISIGWEFYEHLTFKYVIKKTNCNDIICFRIEDIFFNLFGYFIGSIFSTYLLRYYSYQIIHLYNLSIK
jgi:hypothetical protein